MPVARTLKALVAIISLTIVLSGVAPRAVYAQPRPQPFPQPKAEAPTEAERPAGAKPGAAIFPLKAIWTVHLDTPPALPPVYDDRYAYMLLKADADRGFPASRLVAVSLSNGSTRWSREGGAIDTMAAGEGDLFATAGPLLQAFSCADGTPRWQTPLGAPLSAPLLLAGGWLVAATQASDLILMRAADGAKMWQVHLPSPAAGRPAIAGDALYLPLTDNRVVCLKLQSGAVVWDEKILSQPTTILALDDRLYVGTAKQWFYSLQPKDGRVAWRFPIGAAVAGTPSADSTRVYFLALDNLLRALDRHGGPLKWRRMLVRRDRFGPMRAGDVLFVSGFSQAIQAFDLYTGAPAGSFDAPTDLNVPVHVVHGLIDADFLVVAVTGEGELMVLRPQSLEPEPFSAAGTAYLLTGFPVWKY